MADKTKIEWTDATWNVVNGCTVHSPGCTNCYAMKQAHRFPPRQGLTVKTNGGMVWTGEVRFNEAVLTQPLRWKRPRRIFVCAHGDLFHDAVPDEWIDRVFAVMALCPQHQFQVLTKRIARMRDYLSNDELPHRLAALILNRLLPVEELVKHQPWPIINSNGPLPSNLKLSRQIVPLPLPNVWLGVSVEDQQRADERVPDLLATPAAVRWLSCEPLLGPVDLGCIEQRGREVIRADILDALRGHALIGDEDGDNFEVLADTAKIDWIVVGGESGPKARPMHPDWARSLRDQCEIAGVPFLFKQWGEWGVYDSSIHDGTNADPSAVFGGPGKRAIVFWPEGLGPEQLIPLGKKRAGRLLDGAEHNGFPVPHG